MSQAFMLGINFKNESSSPQPAMDCSDSKKAYVAVGYCFDALGNSSS